MECKYVQDKLIALHHLELIDTLWNVNIAKFVMIVTPVAELIDTLWNVNKAAQWCNENGTWN